MRFRPASKKNRRRMRLGSDIVHIPRFAKTLQENRAYFLEEVFLPEEQREGTAEHLAGVFAAKEAVGKALEGKHGAWKEIQIGYEENGKPYVQKLPEEGWEAELSIAHDGEYAIANVVLSAPD